MRTRVLYPVLLALATMMVGCKGVDKAVGLRYTPADAHFDQTSAPVYVLMTKEAHGLPSNENNLRIIGEFENRQGKKTANVLSSYPINQWVRGAIANELRADGINASEADAAPPGAWVVDSTLTEMSSDTSNHWSTSEVKAHLAITFRVSGPGAASGMANEFTQGGDASAKSSQGVLNNVRDAYEQALRNLLHDAAPRIKAQMTGGR